MLVKVRYNGVALNPNSSLLVNQAATIKLFFRRITEHKLNGTGISNKKPPTINASGFIFRFYKQSIDNKMLYKNILSIR
ncbi:hypothetical protein CXF71_14185 [Colwellia sp. 12G3]|nr:hypothetical protein CXF71_14185 [Colwellia sp. 12G3]